MGHGGKYATPPRLNPSQHPQAGRPSGSTYLGNLSNHYPLASYPAQAAEEVDFRCPALKGRLTSKDLRLRPSTRAQRNDIGSGDKCGGHLGGIAGGNDYVVVFAGPKTTENRRRFLRLDQRQISQEGKDVFGWLQSRGDEGDFDIFVVEVPSQRGGQAYSLLIYCRRQDSGCGVVKHDAKLAFIFAAELAHFERAGAGRGFPVHMAGRVVGHIFADEVKIVAATAHKGFELAGDHGKNFEELFGGF